MTSYLEFSIFPYSGGSIGQKLYFARLKVRKPIFEKSFLSHAANFSLTQLFVHCVAQKTFLVIYGLPNLSAIYKVSDLLH